MKFCYFASVSGLYLLVFTLVPEANCEEFENISTTREGELVLLHVIFRHGNRTPQPEELYPKDPYLNETYYPDGFGQLTNVGKMWAYNVGRKLRQSYDEFLGKNCLPETVDARSTDYNRTKMSLELVLASLYPPQNKQIWNKALPWLPIPYNYWPKSNDPILLGVECPHYLRLYNDIINSTKLQEEFKKYSDLFMYISENTGLNVTTFQSVYNLYFGLATEEERGFKLPQWTEEIWPDTMKNVTVKEYDVQTGNRDLKRMASGYLIQKIIKDTQDHIKGRTEGRKIYLYSAHEHNIADLLLTLGIFDPPDIPNYGSYVVFEIRSRNKAYGVKIYYENYNSKQPKLLTLPACTSFCKLEKFISLTEEYMPSLNLCYQ